MNFLKKILNTVFSNSHKEASKKTCIHFFDDSGFKAILNGNDREVAWEEIEEIHAYKRDLLTIDQVCIDIVLSKTYISFSEDTEGWKDLIKHINLKFPSIEEDWFWKVDQPPFKKNFTILYKKKI